ncbi:MAG: SCO family protein [Deltaproteobacteria bacterium]
MYKKIVIVIILILYMGIAFSAVQVYKTNKNNDDYYGIYYGKDAPDFTLRDQDGNQVSLSQFKGKDVLLSFGYTTCPDICPATLARMNSVTKQLKNATKKVQVLFITIDPDRDTERRLKEYIPYFNKSFIGLTGNQDEIKKVADSYSVFYEKSEPGNSGPNYFMNHTQTVYLIDHSGKLILIYPYENLSPEMIASDINKTYRNNG